MPEWATLWHRRPGFAAPESASGLLTPPGTRLALARSRNELPGGMVSLLVSRGLRAMVPLGRGGPERRRVRS